MEMGFGVGLDVMWRMVFTRLGFWVLGSMRLLWVWAWVGDVGLLGGREERW